MLTAIAEAIAFEPVRHKQPDWALHWEDEVAAHRVTEGTQNMLVSSQEHMSDALQSLKLRGEQPVGRLAKHEALTHVHDWSPTQLVTD
jgi:hypothetical protein